MTAWLERRRKRRRLAALRAEAQRRIDIGERPGAELVLEIDRLKWELR